MIINRLKPYMAQRQEGGRPLMSILGVISGEILTRLEQEGTSSLRHLIRELDWPAPLVTMAVGALVREGLIAAEEQELEILLKIRREWAIPGTAGETANGYSAE